MEVLFALLQRSHWMALACAIFRNRDSSPGVFFGDTTIRCRRDICTACGWLESSAGSDTRQWSHRESLDTHFRLWLKVWVDFPLPLPLSIISLPLTSKQTLGGDWSCCTLPNISLSCCRLASRIHDRGLTSFGLPTAPSWIISSRSSHRPAVSRNTSPGHQFGGLNIDWTEPCLF